MTAIGKESYHWGGDPNATQIGIRVVPGSIHNGETVNVKVAIHNGSSRPLTIESQFTLVVQRGELTEEHVGGPRSAEALAVSPGATLEVAGWQLDGEQLGSDAGECLVWTVHRPSTGRELRSGIARIEVLA
jgi:hypothetical protein